MIHVDNGYLSIYKPQAPHYYVTLFSLYSSPSLISAFPAMAVGRHMAILLIPVLSLCGATEYYVRPTEPTNTSCPAQPCLTLNQYINDSDRYFKSNTVFKFLPGTHHMDAPLDIGYVHNLSLESLHSLSNEHPHLVPLFTCEAESGSDCLHVLIEYVNVAVCCVAAKLHNVHNVTFKGISISTITANMSGVALQDASNSSLQVSIACYVMSRYDLRIGILALDSNFFEVHSSSASNCSCGVVLYNTNNSYIIKATAKYSYILELVSSIGSIGGSGMYLLFTTNTTVINPTVIHNSFDGMHLEYATNTIIINTTAKHNYYDGMYIWGSINIAIINTSTMHNDGNGMYFWNPMNLTLINTTATYNDGHGILLWNSTIMNIMNTNIMYSGDIGMGLWYGDSINITNTDVMHSDGYGIELYLCTNVVTISTAAMYNVHSGLLLRGTTNTSIINIATTHNKETGITCCDTTNTNIINVTVTCNGDNGMLLYSAMETHISKASQMHNGWRRKVTTLNGDVLSTADPTTLPAVIVLYYSSLHVSGSNMTKNPVSAVKAIASNITLSGNVLISDNQGIAGSGFILAQTSILKVVEDSAIHIRNNHAINTGGVFYINSDQYYSMLFSSNTLIKRSTCFLSAEGNRSRKRLTFVNNSAGKGGDVLYGGQVALGLDGDWNCLLSFKNVSNISQNSLSLITSDPSRVCLCNASEQPDCLIVADPTLHSIYPGQSISLSAVVVGQEFGTVAGPVYAQFLQRSATETSPQLETWQMIQHVTQEKCNVLHYTIFSPGDVPEAVLVLTTDNRNVSQFPTHNNKYKEIWNLERVYSTSQLDSIEYSNYPVYVNITLLPCPTGFMLKTDMPFSCDCNTLLQGLQGVKCHIQDKTIGRSGLVWVGTLKNDNETVVASEYCLFDYCNKGDSNVTLNNPDSQCNYNHSGTLCGGCQPGLSLALGSAQCLVCSNKYLSLLIPFALAGPAVVFFVKVLDLTIAQGSINGLIFYANIVKTNEYIFLPQRQTNPLTIFIAWLNLDLGVETCFFRGLTAYTKTWLQFVFPFYIWSIAGFIIILAKYSGRAAKMMGNNSVPVLATLFLLSYAKIFRTIITALSYTILYSSQGPKAVWSADGNLDYLDPKHAPLFAIAAIALIFLWLPYTLLLFLGQWLHKCNWRLIDSILMKMKPFLDAHYGPLKGKHHYWFGALLLVRAAILLISALTPTNHADIVYLCSSIFSILLIYFGLMVYNNMLVAMFDVSFFMNLALLCVANLFTTRSGGGQSCAAYTLIGMAFVQFLGLIIFKLFSILKNSERVNACLHREQQAENDWELYEEAALLREMESDNEEDSDGSENGSIPTYPW